MKHAYTIKYIILLYVCLFYDDYAVSRSLENFGSVKHQGKKQLYDNPRKTYLQRIARPLFH